jgi:pimeloyl-ACP methyl ester carboxylesterase
MPLLPVNAEGTRHKVDEAALRAALAALPPRAPVVVMLHGFRYAPGVGRHCPHGHILSLTPRRDIPRAVSWPRHLRLAGPADGLALAFGWNARGTIWAAQSRTPATAEALAGLVRRLRTLAPDRPIDVMAHSLGARVALAALPRLAAGDVGRLLLLSPADLRPHAEAAMASPAGRAAEVVNITCRANAMFDFCVETLLAARFQTSVSQGLSKPARNWIDLVIDDPDAEQALAGLGYPLRPASVRVCHWQPYLRPGLFALYRALLSRQISLASLRAALAASSDRPARPALPLSGVPA